MKQTKEQIQKLLENAASEQENSRAIGRRLRSALHRLRGMYNEASLLREKNGWQQWLADNYYTLEGHGKQALRELQGFRGGQKQFAMLYCQLAAVFGGLASQLTEESLLEVLTEISAVREIGEQQFDFLQPALKTICVVTAAGAEEDDAAERERRISGAIVTLNQMAEIDFDALTCAVSVSENILLQDPAGIYPRMAEVSRRHYRHIVARIARRCGVFEKEVASDVLHCAAEATGERRRHVGYYLMGHDPQTVGARRRGVAFALLSAALPVFLAALMGALLKSIVCGLLLLLPLAELTRQLLLPLMLQGVHPQHLPRMQLEESELPEIAVAVTTLLPNAEDAGQLRARLEQLYFSNKSERLTFCLLADFREDRKPYNPRDEARLQAAKEMVRSLNAEYQNRFVLFIRRRVWCKTQDSFCGWERKRGAIEEFIKFAAGGERSACCFEGDRERLKKVRYLLTLDADTGLGFDAAIRLAAVAAHPLNRAVIGKTGKVIAGYGILTGRMAANPIDDKQTGFMHLLEGDSGISSYEQECGSLYQDLFGETCFVGKGLIDVVAYQKVLIRRFPENSLLSHDILEGAYLRTGLVSDLEMTETAPSNTLAWFARLHRWTRGDWQNLRFLGSGYRDGAVRRENPIGWMARIFLLENLRVSLTPVVSLLAVLFFSLLIPLSTRTTIALNLILMLSIVMGPLKAALMAAVRERQAAFTRRFFSRGLPRFWELLARAGGMLLLFAQRAAVCADAICRSMWRMLISRRNLLQWTTAAQAESERILLREVVHKSAFSIFCGLLLLLFAGDWVGRLFGLAALCYPFFAVRTARVFQEKKELPNRAQRELMVGWCARMLGYYESYANKKNHWLPPDNVQFSPVEAVARRTSPTNIGMMLLSYLAARDMHLIDSAALQIRIARTLDTVEKLETKQGNLYNWYATDDLRVLPEKFVSSVDSGNFLCALVALKEGIMEFSAEEPKLRATSERIERMLAETDFSIFYDPQRKLFSIGMDELGEKSRSHYDFLMSEARSASYFAVATRQAPYRHWRALSRAMSRNGPYVGPVSWTGTMFEYFMPHLLLPVYSGSLLGEALHYALYCQKRRAARAKTPWGISESGYLAFDDALNYQYKAHGVQRLGVKQGLDAECVVSPYSSFLALPYDLSGGIENLCELEQLGLLGQYGHYEAADFTHGRAGKNSYGVVRSYMAHHIGMSMTACANALFDNVMQKRFMRDKQMRSAREFLQEKQAKDAVVYDRMKEFSKRNRPGGAQPVTEVHSAPLPQLPACTMLANGSLSHLFTDTGVSFLRYSDTDLTRRTEDLLQHPQGIFTIVKFFGKTLTATAAPFYPAREEHSAVFEGDAVCYYAKKEELRLTQRFSLERACPVERCRITVHNDSPIKAMAELLVYFEPIVSRYGEYAAHPAFSKLFLLGNRDEATDTFTFFRRHREGNTGLFLTVGFVKTYAYEFTLLREQATPYPAGLNALLRPESIRMEGGNATPDGCFAARLQLLVPAKGQGEVELLFSCAQSREESVENLVQARREKACPAYSPLQSDSMAGRLGSRLLPQILFPRSADRQQSEALAENSRGQDALWTLGISGDRPIVLFDWESRPDRAALDAYLRFWRLMRLHRVEFDFCVLGAMAEKLPAGVCRLDSATLDPELICTLRAAACHVIGTPEEADEPRPPAFLPATLLPVDPVPIAQADERFNVVGGFYQGERFFVQRTTPLPFSHILANEQFGCLLQDASLGNSWWQNARECKLSPWLNDIATGNDGERMLLRVDDRIYDLCMQAQASFSPEDACYEGIAGGIRTLVRVQIDPCAAIKYLDVLLENETEREVEIICAYAIEPVLGVSRQTAKFTRFEQYHGCLLLQNPYNTEIACHAAVHVPGEYPSYMTDRAAFYAGGWAAAELAPNNDPIAGTLVRKRLPPRRREQIRFIVAAAKTREAVIELAIRPQPLEEKHPPLRQIRINTPSEPLNRFINTFCPHQIRAGRLLGRAAFYQCSGAYGFRDQLQDAGGYLLLDPQIAKEQILRCCAAQFPEGDALHWWHPLPKGTRGVRTRFSDDLLWLPYTVCDYLDATKDNALLETQVPFCRGEALTDEEQERYMEVQPTEEQASVFYHCVRAIERGLRLGERGLALIGCGDWNDGFSKIGVGGKGESVWLSMFLIIVLERFSVVCTQNGEGKRADDWRAAAKQLRESIDKNAWDGKWYLRAFFDDGFSIGGHVNDECRIDLLPQSFAALCKMPDQGRIQSALTEAMTRLVDDKHGIIKLFTPPFDRSAHNPGYIMAYPGGIRENGGQYTHAAIWLAGALLQENRTAEGWALLDMLNPTARCTNATRAQQMKTEPYYIAADLYTHSGCYGHGGWSLYTGAAAWYYRTVLQNLLGLVFSGDTLTVQPNLPPEWKHFEIRIAQGGGEITVEYKRTGKAAMTVDGVAADRLILDGKSHRLYLAF